MAGFRVYDNPWNAKCPAEALHDDSWLSPGSFFLHLVSANVDMRMELGFLTITSSLWLPVGTGQRPISWPTRPGQASRDWVRTNTAFEELQVQTGTQNTGHTWHVKPILRIYILIISTFLHNLYSKQSTEKNKTKRYLNVCILIHDIYRGVLMWFRSCRKSI